MPDMMHIVHLSLFADLAASLLLDWTDSQQYVSAASRELRLDELWQSYRSWCERSCVPDRCSRKLFRTSTLRATNAYVEISQKICSGTAARYAIFWFASVAQRFSDLHGTSADHLRAGAAGGLALLERACVQGKRILADTVCVGMKRNYVIYRSAYNQLAQLALQNHLFRYHLRPKQHQLEHLIYDFLPRNPRYLSNYLDEDLIRRTKTQAKTTHPAYMSQQVLSRYCTAAALKWAGKDVV